MKQWPNTLLQYVPWLLLLFGADAFAALLLWIADVQAFYSLASVILLATLLFFSAVCMVLIRREQKRTKAFSDFLHNPDLCSEETLLHTVDQEEYVEAWAHEAKTPLSLLTLLLDNRRDELSDDLSFKLDHIRNRLQESVDQMLFYARLKGVRKDYLFEHLSVRACLDEVLDDYRPLLQEKQFRVRLELSDHTACSDRRGLRFLLGQIISNSVKYCSREPELHIFSLRQDDRFLLCIRDNGIGVRSCDLPWIFEKGFTGDSGEGRKKATGMGLYLADEMARELNLTLEARSRWGEGFEIRISFPVVL